MPWQQPSPGPSRCGHGRGEGLVLPIRADHVRPEAGAPPVGELLEHDVGLRAGGDEVHVVDDRVDAHSKSRGRPGAGEGEADHGGPLYGLAEPFVQVLGACKKGVAAGLRAVALGGVDPDVGPAAGVEGAPAGGREVQGADQPGGHSGGCRGLLGAGEGQDQGVGADGHGHSRVNS